MDAEEDFLRRLLGLFGELGRGPAIYFPLPSLGA
jgi:hypothetical protein